MFFKNFFTYYNMKFSYLLHFCTFLDKKNTQENFTRTKLSATFCHNANVNTAEFQEACETLSSSTCAATAGEVGTEWTEPREEWRASEVSRGCWERETWAHARAERVIVTQLWDLWTIRMILAGAINANKLGEFRFSRSLTWWKKLFVYFFLNLCKWYKKLLSILQAVEKKHWKLTYYAFKRHVKNHKI